ncbi:MAG TPA: phage major tail tube protein [Candidatus Bilophila faecipullorum]|uniref:Phage major tail tube protein n=1 Tax=Candidatus Bilophila faecipullorum TaxID=2838482 RepID=A0A9D1R0N4_9BACT|nr:phage major tail tube protein [uncultured Bilophila sp.]HIW78790.1 phage major tail tube protein [Candidatus Bilophila faecipullorum]
MATKISVNNVVNAAIYLNGNSFLGRAEEVKLPEITAIMKEHKALGMVGKFELPAGFDKMEGEIKWNSFYEDAMRVQGDIFTYHSIQCRSNVETYSSPGRFRQVPLVTFLTIQFKGSPLGEFKQHEGVGLTAKFSCTYIKQVLAGQEKLELDVLANIYKVDGVDLLADYRANIGS